MVEPKLVLTEEELGELNQKQKIFYQKAREAFERNVSEYDFHLMILVEAMHQNFFYKKPLLRDELVEQPFYQILENLWIELGVKQGTMSRAAEKDDGDPLLAQGPPHY